METSALDSASFYDIVAAFAPPGLERQARVLLAEAEAALARIETQIKALTVARDFQRGRIAALKYAMSPIRLLPSDILAEIFLDTIDVSRGLHYRSASLSNLAFMPVLRLASVCAHWRQLAVCDPRMWRGEISLKVANVSATYIEITGLMLQRSSPHPLDLTLGVKDRSKSPAFSTEVLSAVLGCAQRWKSLRIETNVLHLLKAPLPRLERLERVLVELVSRSTDMTTSFLLDAPLLAHARITLNHLEKIPLPWTQLVELVLTSGDNPSSILTILSGCTALRTLELNMIAWDGDAGVLQHPFVIPNLHQLSVNFMQPDSGDGTTAPFFANLTSPALRQLKVTFEFLDNGPLDPEFISFLRRSPELQSLSITECDMDSAFLSTILLNTPSLESLNLACCFSCLGQEFFQRLTYTNGATNSFPAAPRLREIDLESCRGDFREEDVMDMVLSRWWTDAQLAALPTPPLVARWNDISISTVDGMQKTDEFKAWINNRCEEGLKLYIH
ncbi:F-box domain-containing protein [Mycena chlorophos]|uniref:F-box domain-containing protein n=1 Tax=Mycena chlorophos TaxID=658473 RepID=A0A8H6VP10_MYCCL|nr:F-box domain-containing protein [Mycena chlorophos]